MNADGSHELNPYVPPSSDVNAGKMPPPHRLEGELADRGTRFVAQLLDGLMALVLIVPGMVTGIRSGAFHNGDKLDLFRAFAAGGIGTVSGLAWLALLLFQAYLVTTTGQSLGKRWLKIRIVKLDGSPVNFMSGVLLRHWLFMGLQYLPMLGPAAGVADPLFIFRADRRCFHDFVAGTKVIRLKEAAQVRVA